jgi:colanic acid/amylovoran biosynthesis glycosyltransferase
MAGETPAGRTGKMPVLRPQLHPLARPFTLRAMREVAYLFERFPSFGQTFCYREVAELERQGATVHVFSIRRPADEPPQDWDQHLVDRVHYLPEEKPLVAKVDRILKSNAVSKESRAAVESWGRQSDFLRLYQAIYIGLRLQERGLRHVHAHFAGMAARTAYWISQFFGLPFSFTAHANDIFAPRDFVVSLPKLMESASAIVTVSDYAVGMLRERYPASAAKIHRVYNGVALSRFPQTDFAASPPVIVSVGRLIEKKGFGDLISACALLRSRGHRFECRIIGEGPLEESLRAQIAAAGLGNCVMLTGPLPQIEVVSQLSHATLFALPCTRESDGGMDNLPTVIMEAMAAGLPVISTPLAGVPEMVEPGVTGELVPERDPAALCAAIERLLADPERARTLGARGREMAREKFSIEGSTRQLQKIFDDL